MNIFWRQKILKFFCKWTNKIQVFNYATVENFITIWTYPTFQEIALKFMNFIGLFAKKLENLLFPENIVIGRLSSKFSGLSVCNKLYLPNN